MMLTILFALPTAESLIGRITLIKSSEHFWAEKRYVGSGCVDYAGFTDYKIVDCLAVRKDILSIIRHFQVGSVFCRHERSRESKMTLPNLSSISFLE